MQAKRSPINLLFAHPPHQLKNSVRELWVNQPVIIRRRQSLSSVDKFLKT